MYTSTPLSPEEAPREGSDAHVFLKNRREVRIEDLHAGDVFFEVSLKTGRVIRYEAVSDPYFHQGTWWVQAVRGQIDDLPGPVGAGESSQVRYCR